MTKIAILLIASVLIFACKAQQPNLSGNVSIVCKEFFGIVKVDIPNIISIEQRHQMPDNSRDGITSIEIYKFLHGSDTGTFELTIPLRESDEVLRNKYDETFFDVLRNEIRWTHQKAKKYQRKAVMLDNVSLNGFTFDDGFKLCTYVNNGMLTVTMTGVSDSAFCESVIKSIKITPW